MSSAAMPRIPREQELIAEVRAYFNGASRIAPRDTHLLACLVGMDDAAEHARLATEALEKADREQAEILDQLRAERTRRAEVEQQIETADRTAYEAFGAIAKVCNETTRAKILVAQPVSAGSGAGVR